MSVHSVRAAAPQVARKTAVADLVSVRIQADHCPQVHLRVFGLLAQLGLEPLTMSFVRKDAASELECAFAPADPARVELLLHKLRAIISVRDAEILD